MAIFREGPLNREWRRASSKRWLIMRAHVVGIEAFGWSMDKPVLQPLGQPARTLTWEELEEMVEEAELAAKTKAQATTAATESAATSGGAA